MSEKSKNILLGVLIVGLVSMTVAYAALSTSLQINGTATVAQTKWDIHFTNVQVDTNNTTAETYSLGTLDNTSSYTAGSKGTLIDNLTVTLNKPTDKLVVNFDIVNDGTIDAKLSAFNKHITLGNSVVSTDTADTNNVVTYTINCANTGDKVKPVAEAPVQELAKNGGTASCVLTVQYDNNAMGGVGQQTSQTAGQDQTVNQDAKTFKFDAAWTYVQK